VSALLAPAVAALPILPELVEYVTGLYRLFIPPQWRTPFWLGLMSTAGVVLQTRPRRVLLFAVDTPRWDRLDAVSDRLLSRWLAPGLGLALLAMLATWVPHYLTWAWWPDMDHFGIAAQSWDAGVVPYRDILDYNFPGPTYVMWLIGKLAGWGKTAPAYAFDAAILVVLVAVVAAWSRRVFGSALPGLVGDAIALNYYLSFDNSLVAQRDWYTATFVILGLAVPQGWPGRAGRLASALGLTAALAYRPYAVLFLPALVSAVDETARRPGVPVREAVRAFAEWALASVVLVSLAFAPLFVAGVADDFVRDLGYLRPGGSYNRFTAEGFTRRLIEGLRDGRLLVGLAVCVGVTVFGPVRFRRAARTWVLALLGALCYRPLSPVDHGYLTQPLALIGSVGLAFALGCVLGLGWLAPSVRLLIVGAVLARSETGIPRHCSLRRSIEAVVALGRGVAPSHSPLGNKDTLPDQPVFLGDYTWPDYVRLLEYLRSTTDPRTPVANLLRRNPFPPVNGPVGRFTPFPCVDGVLWLRWLGPELEPAFVRSLESSPNVVVVWAPHEHPLERRLDLDRLTGVVRRDFRPEARFGVFEVWRRAPGAKPRPSPTPSAPP
jgi:hypothetical protein